MANNKDCTDCEPETVTARREVTIKVKATVLIPANGVEGAYEAQAQKGLTDALNVGGALVQSVTSKTKAT